MKISVIGIGTWGTALAIHLKNNGHEVTLYGRIEDNTLEIAKNRTHPFLKGIDIPNDIKITTDLSLATQNKFLVMAVPSQFVRPVLSKIVECTSDEKIIINVAKGLEIETGKRISEIVADVSNNRYKYSILSGPTHAEEVANGLPAAIVSASKNVELAKKVQEIFNNGVLRVYTSNDVKGVEIGSSFKNIVAIAVGAIDGLNLGDNAKAAIITRGLTEMKLLGTALGANPETFNGLTGIGDLIVTCMSKHSRNRSFGEQLGKGKKSEDILKETSMVTEGVYATKAFYLLSKKLDCELPITNEVYKTIYEGKTPLMSLQDLMSREMKMESEEVDERE